MKARGPRLVALTLAGVAGAMLAVLIGSAGAAPPSTTTLGSVTGSPAMNICSSGIDCTYVPFTNVESPELEVPFDGAVTQFSVNAGSAGGTVTLRVLRPASGGQFTGAGSSPAETITTPGINTFTVNLPVDSGDVLALDNATSALLFDTTSSVPITAYYQSPSLADGATAAPNENRSGYRLLLSAVVEASGTTTATTTSTTTAGPPPPPSLANVSESNGAWREGGKRSRHKLPVGTKFSFTLSESARVTFTFFAQLGGRRVKSTCVAQTKRNRHHPACTRAPAAGSLSATERAGSDSVAFSGRIGGHKLRPGSYTVLITAANSANETSNTVALAFTVSRK